MDQGENWQGHPWAQAEHRTVGPHRAWCHSCGTWCYPPDEGGTDGIGCYCCNEPAYGWLLAEARWWADWLRWQYGDDCPDNWPAHIPSFAPTVDGKHELFVGYNLPWEVPHQP